MDCVCLCVHCIDGVCVFIALIVCVCVCVCVCFVYVEKGVLRRES
jgi:hypothetical protein